MLIKLSIWCRIYKSVKSSWQLIPPCGNWKTVLFHFALKLAFFGGNLCAIFWLRKEEIMKTNIRGGIFHLTKYVLFFFIILVHSCTSTSAMRLEGKDFKENLSGQWEGRWTYGPGRSDIYHLKILKIDANLFNWWANMDLFGTPSCSAASAFS